ncbi:hypothetical protein RSOLAG22IIIB_08129 [Rhizoctonia solani]|uniref:Uncharacterized protein n=1 Tax=Rhizoctonia solani TaxID=456999 RepID=A0A0K6FS47_9AGAM|nr:hypothetical protein RSOLAG22IIIB_08129 [Rhizoctonia solani]
MEALQNEQNNPLEPPEVPRVGRLWKAAMCALTRLFGILKHILMVYLMAIILRNAVSELIPEAPCKHPSLTRYFPHCAYELNPQERSAINPDFVTLARLQSQLEVVMEDSAKNSLVAVNIKCSEMALRDLSASIKLSSLARKHILEEEIKHFVIDSQAASGDLQEFSSRVRASVARIMYLNEDTMMALESGKSLEILGVFYSMVNGLIPTEWDTASTHRKRMEDIWLQGIELLDRTLRELIHQARHNIGSLQKLRERLNNIQDMVTKEEHEIHDEEQAFEREWFSEWKERFKFNEEKRQSHSDNRKLLWVVDKDSLRARDYTVGVLSNLEDMSRSLRILRGEVSRPIIASGLSKIPIEAHISNIRRTTEQLVYGQTRMREIDDSYRWKRLCSN